MSRTRDVVVLPLAAGELERACAVLGLAFAGNPSTLVNVRGDHTRAERTMRRVVRVAKLARPYSRVLVAHLDDEIVGVLNAAPWPRCQMGVVDTLRTAPGLVRALRWALPRAARMTSARARHDPHEPHWHLGPIGVHPDHQGRGVGSALLSSFLAEVDAEDAAAFLETDVERNEVLYQRFGFHTVTREEILGVDTRFMWRTPRRRS